MAFAIASDPPLNGTNFHPFFYPTQSKISLLSPLYNIFGSNIDILQLRWPLTANYQYLQSYSLSPKLLYVYNIKFKLCAKHVLTVRELFSMVVNKIIFQNMIMACKIPPPHCKCHLKIPFFGRLPLGRPKFGHCLPLFCFHDCSLFRSKPVSTSWCFGARAGASCNYEQSKTK